jgi:diguanylate cyclase (GGDEF)-like protein
MKMQATSNRLPFPAKNRTPLFKLAARDIHTPIRRSVVFTIMALALAAHGAVIFLSGNSTRVSSLCVTLFSLSSALACYRRSTRTSGPVRRKWDFLASALCLWSFGAATYTLQLFFPALARIDALGPEFYFLVYGIPVLLAVSSSNEERDSVLFILIDSFQAIFAVVLVYLDISLSPRGASSAAGMPTLTNLYAAGAWVLAIAACLRLLAQPRGEEKTLYRILFVYLCFFAVLASPWHGSAFFESLPIGRYRDLIADLVFLLLTAGCLLIRVEVEPEGNVIETNTFALVLTNGSPILFTLAVLVLGAIIARVHFTLGISAITLSLVIYCFRAALLQSAYLRAQHELTRSQFALREANVRLKQLSLHDALTGLPNRRLFNQTLESEWNRAMRNRRPLSLVIADVDCFKALNDAYGHPAGDECLCDVASALNSSLRRAGEVASRYGGEEFAAILPDADAASAATVAETMREAVAALQISNEGSMVQPFVTASFGVATAFPVDGTEAASLVDSADEALYRAKRNGRNRVESALTALVDH